MFSTLIRTNFLLLESNLLSADTFSFDWCQTLSYSEELTLYHTISAFNDPETEGNQHFLLFPQCFLPFPKQISIFQSHLCCRLQIDW